MPTNDSAALIRLGDISISFGDTAVLSGIDLIIPDHQRLALIGRNGAGKSTLLKILAGLVQPDSGERELRQDLVVAYLEQAVPTSTEGNVYQVVAGGAGKTGALLARYNALCLAPAGKPLPGPDLEQVQLAIDQADGWSMAQRLDAVLSRMELDGDADFSRLSGGMKRRVMLARALLLDPDVLLLDEPTNHLDLAAIDWLEGYLQTLQCTLVFITHDRAFLRTLATGIIDLDRGKATLWPGNYERYLTGKAHELEVEERHNAEFDKKLAQEETWIRQGIKARRTRNEGRVRALKKMREQRRQRVAATGSARMQANSGERSGKRVMDVENLSFAYDGNVLIDNFSTSIQRGDKIAIIGPNGVGKSTLVRLLLGEIKPQSGTIDTGTNLQVAYFDQLRAGLDTTQTAQENVSGGRDMVTVNGEQRHIISYLQDFLFSPARARAPITALSGGETNRLMLAKLFLQPSNLLVLDEPTNDLDVETLELLESLLCDYDGTLLLISHDREFIDNVATSCLVFTARGRIREYVGGYSDYARTAAVASSSAKPKTGNRTGGTSKAGSEGPKATASSGGARKSARKLSYKEQRELDTLPAQIETMETELEALQVQMSQPDFYLESDTNRAVIEAADRLSKELETAFERWGELEQLQQDLTDNS